MIYERSSDCNVITSAVDWLERLLSKMARVHSFIHQRTDLGGVMSKWLQWHLTTLNEKTEIAAQDENSLWSCAAEAVGVASGKK